MSTTVPPFEPPTSERRSPSMTEPSAAPDEPGEPSDRVARFDAEVSAMKLKAGRSGQERLIVSASVVGMVGGLVLAIVAYSASLNVTATPGSNIDVLDSNSYQILALFGVGLSVVAGLVFLRYSLAQFLRFWLLRQSYEQQAAVRAAAITTPGAPD